MCVEGKFIWPLVSNFKVYRRSCSISLGISINLIWSTFLYRTTNGCWQLCSANCTPKQRNTGTMDNFQSIEYICISFELLNTFVKHICCRKWLLPILASVDNCYCNNKRKASQHTDSHSSLGHLPIINNVKGSIYGLQLLLVNKSKVLFMQFVILQRLRGCWTTQII